MNLELLNIIFNIGSLIISAVAIWIIIYNIIIDDRKLSKQVQSFYENIENLIFISYQNEYYEIKYKELADKTDEIHKGKEESTRLTYELKYYKNMIFSDSLENDMYLRYLGLVKLSEYELWFNKSLISMDEKGYLFNEGYNKTRSFSGSNLEKENIEAINSFLKSLRDYWNENYSKTIIRPKLKLNLNFEDLKGYKKN